MANSVNKYFSKWQVATGFEARLREAFEGATLAEIAAKIGENYHTVRNWVKSKRDPPPQFFVAVAELTNCSLNWLLTGKGPILSSAHLSKKLINRTSSQELSPEMRAEIQAETQKQVIAVLRILISDKDEQFVNSLLKQLHLEERPK